MEVLVSPINLVRQVEHGQEKFADKMKEVIHPLWVPAVLDKSGKLSPSELLDPWLVRSVLEPVQQLPDSKWLSVTFGNIDDADRFFTGNDVPREKWSEYSQYLDKLFKNVCSATIQDFEFRGFIADRNITVMIDSSYGETTAAIIELYDHTREKEKFPLLLERFSSPDSPPLKELFPETKYTILSGSHVGQMGNDFPLSPSQRQALFHHFQLSNGEIMAVNGPPGTGKTTLLQSVAANAVVEGALRGGSPFVLAVSSTNNQAIENIIESFKKPAPSIVNLQTAGCRISQVMLFFSLLFPGRFKKEFSTPNITGKACPIPLKTGSTWNRRKSSI